MWVRFVRRADFIFSAASACTSCPTASKRSASSASFPTPTNGGRSKPSANPSAPRRRPAQQKNRAKRPLKKYCVSPASTSPDARNVKPNSFPHPCPSPQNHPDHETEPRHPTSGKRRTAPPGPLVPAPGKQLYSFVEQGFQSALPPHLNPRNRHCLAYKHHYGTLYAIRK